MLDQELRKTYSPDDVAITATHIDVCGTAYAVSKLVSVSVEDGTQFAQAATVQSRQNWEHADKRWRARIIKTALGLTSLVVILAITVFSALSLFDSIVGRQPWNLTAILGLPLAALMIKLLEKLHGPLYSSDIRFLFAAGRNRPAEPTVVQPVHTVTLGLEGGRRDLPFRSLAEAKLVRDRLQTAMASAGHGATAAAQLRELNDLRLQGIITAEEFERAKSLWLGRPESRKKATLDQLDKLGSLLASGVLTESEFNMKKWDILSSS